MKMTSCKKIIYSNLCVLCLFHYFTRFSTYWQRNLTLYYIVSRFWNFMEYTFYNYKNPEKYDYNIWNFRIISLRNKNQLWATQHKMCETSVSSLYPYYYLFSKTIFQLFISLCICLHFVFALNTCVFIHHVLLLHILLMVAYSLKIFNISIISSVFTLCSLLLCTI